MPMTPPLAEHPALAELAALPWDIHLIGSRYCGLSSPRSDYDYLLVLPDSGWSAREKARTDLHEIGFRRLPGHGGYGPDERLDSAWTWTDPDGRVPPVDVLICTREEGTRRLRILEAIRSLGDHTGGSLQRVMKAGRGWGPFWQLMHALDVQPGAKAL